MTAGDSDPIVQAPTVSALNDRKAAINIALEELQQLSHDRKLQPDPPTSDHYLIGALLDLVNELRLACNVLLDAELARTRAESLTAQP